LEDLLQYLTGRTGAELNQHRDRVLAYRERYGVA
jgi:orotate phosphoribosyltransferase